ncbi:Methionine aminopeptidase 1A [Morella rubra]|uniref:Methionine aminopeptidase 1A n=1 Tax=Morella rubra TaxID=262757 RepID=A0A6A1WN79_9ROSI|nr:Methionine aminopeptidase 1A [Morella rubra]
MDGGSDVVETTALSCVRCGNPAHLQCPKCVELRLPREGAAFCTQDCFKASWGSHKSVHLKAKLSSIGTGIPHEQNSDLLNEGWLYCLKKGQARSPKLPHFDWTGPLRPYPISSRRAVSARIEKPDWAADGIPKIEPNSDLQHCVEIKTADQIERMRTNCRGIPKIEPNSDLQHCVEIKTADQIERMRTLSKLCITVVNTDVLEMLHALKLPMSWFQGREVDLIAREVLDAAARVIRPGVTTDEIDRVVHDATRHPAGQVETLIIPFPPTKGKEEDIHPLSIIISSPSLAARRSVNEVICHGIPDARKLEDGDIVNVDVTVYYKGVHGDLNETYFVGNVDEESKRLVQCTYECLDKAISIVKPGVRFREIGEVINRHASMSGFSVVKSYCGHGIGELFHCAPNIPHYSSVWRDRMWPDGWTAVTADGKRSAQFEHTLLVTETGVEVLTGRLPSSPNVFPWLNA